MGMHSAWREIAKAVRLGDINAAEFVIDGLHDGAAEQAALGRHDAGRAMRGDRLPELAESETAEQLGRSIYAGKPVINVRKAKKKAA